MNCNQNEKDLDLKPGESLETFSNIIQLIQNYYAGFSKYANEFTIPYLLATVYFNEAEKKKLFNQPPLESFQSYMDLLEFNLDLFNRGFKSSINAISSYNQLEMRNAIAAVMNTFFPFIRNDGENLGDFINRQSQLITMLSDDYPKAIVDIEPEYGFHFERGEHELVAETDRFLMYQIAPVDKKVKIDADKKPILIIPPFVLGANILAFLPYEGRSYAHCFANLGIPTYIRIMKDIQETEALQVMTPEEDCLDTKFFCEKISERNAKPITLNGYCQGGYIAVCDYLTGELDDCVDALITCVSPMDGTRSRGLAKFLNCLPQRFNNLEYGTKTLPSGNKVADGKLMGWIYKLKSIEHETPVVAYYRDLMMFGRLSKSRRAKIGKSAAAINYWLNYERTDLPLSITKMSFDSYSTPVTKEGVLPVRIFDRELNFKRVEEKGVKWLICYGINDDLVEKETALAPIDYVNAEVSAFPKGHVAIATSWSLPTSECSLHSCFGDNCRGPVRFHLDLDEAIDRSKTSASAAIESNEQAPEAEISEKTPAEAGEAEGAASTAKPAIAATTGEQEAGGSEASSKETRPKKAVEVKKAIKSDKKKKSKNTADSEKANHQQANPRTKSKPRKAK